MVQRAQRRKKSGVPEEIRFQTKPEMALGQIPSLVKEDNPRVVVLADAAYGNDNGFREGLEALGIGKGIPPKACLLRMQWPLAPV